MVCNLDIHAIVFLAEVRAIAECAQAMLEGGRRGMPVVICFNSQAALGGLDVYLPGQIKGGATVHGTPGGTGEGKLG